MIPHKNKGETITVNTTETIGYCDSLKNEFVVMDMACMMLNKKCISKEKSAKAGCFIVKDVVYAVLGGFLGFPETPSISKFFINCP